MSDVIFDCTELYQNPIRTGIQRVVREMLRNWPDDGPRLHVVRYDVDRALVRLSEQAVRVLADQEAGTDCLSRDEIALRLAAVDAPPPEPLPEDAVYFIPEVFYDTLRCRYYECLMKAHGKTLAMLGYDFIVYLKPHLFNLRTCLGQIEYLRLIAKAQHVAHISEATRRDYEGRILHAGSPRKGPVLPLGADGLNMERQTWHPDRRNFVALGSIDQRKNQQMIFEAFRMLWRDGHDARLTLIGRAFAAADIAWLDEARNYEQFQWLDEASDENIRRELAAARCTIYVSEAEGYGLPPVESLAVGIPVITTAAMPSLEGLPTVGQIRLEDVTAAAIAEAVETMLTDKAASRLWKDLRQLELSGWADLGSQTALWLETVSADRDHGVATAMETVRLTGTS
ncbi:glycosyltransferase [Aurantimonas endophytica]|uniref:Glycosyltransferase involved in cell wall biosynthesis n=1 Tax=Aurantimonas endophytica TaxID=1522175 RepID=A0A7W6MPM3_9HYPH|nr:glycosyltransferase [Aurantimonas endophytica]MBB4003064.1 glycosyltransferase involved in cell wall biosynthesis [Aurantimonas endophytica]MCO6403935.1 glycosyltransferase [Aurantimonas endophytica]